MKLKILETALETIQALRPVMLRIRREDRGLHRHMTEAMNSLILNLSEGEYSDPGTRKARFHSACGSANEVRGGVLAAQAWGYVRPAQCEPVLAHLDRVVATLYKLTH